MSLDANLLAILACPEDKGPLHFIESEGVLFNPRLGRTYEVRDGIPVMLVEEATDGGASLDYLRGYSGNDTYVFAPGHGHDGEVRTIPSDRYHDVGHRQAHAGAEGALGTDERFAKMLAQF